MPNSAVAAVLERRSSPGFPGRTIDRLLRGKVAGFDPTVVAAWVRRRAVGAAHALRDGSAHLAWGGRFVVRCDDFRMERAGGAPNAERMCGEPQPRSRTALSVIRKFLATTFVRGVLSMQASVAP
jgi:hypothetical protein